MSNEESVQADSDLEITGSQPLTSGNPSPSVDYLNECITPTHRRTWHVNRNTRRSPPAQPALASAGPPPIPPRTPFTPPLPATMGRAAGQVLEKRSSGVRVLHGFAINPPVPRRRCGRHYWKMPLYETKCMDRGAQVEYGPPFGMPVWMGACGIGPLSLVALLSLKAIQLAS